METQHHMGHLTSGQILRNSLLKLLFEGLGTMFLTLAFNISIKSGFAAQQATLLLTLWVMTIFGLKISGAHYNPAISLAFMLKKDVGSFPRILALAYIGAQIAGAFVGAMVSWFLLVPNVGLEASGNIVPMPHYLEDGKLINYSGSTFASIISEPLGAFFVAFFYLTQTEEKTTFSKEKAINCFIIAAAYVGARGMLSGTENTISGQVLNPAIALGTSLVQLIDKRPDGFTYSWIYVLLPLGGAILAVIFQEFVNKKTQEIMQDGGEDDDNDTLLDK